MERERQRAGEKTAGNLKADKGREMAARESKTVGNTAGRGLAARRAKAKEQGQESGGEAGRVHLRAEDRRKG